jgi:hypothetical protein
MSLLLSLGSQLQLGAIEQEHVTERPRSVNAQNSGSQEGAREKSARMKKAAWVTPQRPFRLPLMAVGRLRRGYVAVDATNAQSAPEHRKQPRRIT